MDYCLWIAACTPTRILQAISGAPSTLCYDASLKKINTPHKAHGRADI
jgi:hypothetical protein